MPEQQTSLDAWEVKKKRLTASQNVVLSALVEFGEYGATTNEVAERRRCSPNIISGRFRELEALGKVRLTGETRLTESGCPAKVWVATEVEG